MRVARARKLHEMGYRTATISRVIGVPYNTVWRWVTPKGQEFTKRDRVDARARKESYRQPCPDCGTLMDGSNGRSGAPRLCAKCNAAAQTIWTREAILECLRCYPEVPRAQVWLDEGSKGMRPSVVTIQERFGSWNAAWSAAGFKTRKQGRPPKVAA
jgi:hypothetical protein